MAEQAYHCDEKNLYLVNGVYYFRYQIDHVIRRFSLRTKDKSRALSMAQELRERIAIHGSIGNFEDALSPVAKNKRPQPLSLSDALEIANRLLSGAEKRTKRKGFSLEGMVTKMDLLKLLNKTNGSCEISGIPFNIKSFKKDPFQPSLDRIDSKKGYVKGNVRIVCLIANYAMNTFGERPMIELAEAIASEKQANQKLSDEPCMTDSVN